MKEITREMLALAAKGNQYAIEDLYRLTYNSVYKTTKVLIQDEDTVLDIVQDSYVKAFQSLDQLDCPENFRAWIKKIATNKAKDYLKKKKPILFSEMANEDGDEIDFLDERLDHYPELVIDRKETTRLMKQILDTLSEDQRLVIGMFYYEQMSVKEIAESLGCSENTVKSRLNYGRKKVEVQVKEMEKRGTKLYSLAPLPFLLSLFAMEASATEIPSTVVLEGITAKCAAGSAVPAGTASVGAKAAAHAGAKAATGAGAKALTTKIIAGVLAVTVAGGGTILALSSNDREEAEPTQQIVSTETAAPAETTLPAEQETTIPETTVETVAAVAAEEAYQGITAEYQAVLGIDSAAFLHAPENYFNGDHMAIRYYHMYHCDHFYYAYMDIDGNGMEELLIGFGPEDYIWFVDLYGFDGEQAVQLIDEPTLGDRSMLALLADDTLYLALGSSAEEVSHIYLKVDGCSVKEVPDTIAERVTDIPWQAFDLPEIPVSEPFFDSVLVGMREVLAMSTEDYDSNKEYYDSVYGHWGEGVPWMIMHRQAGDYTMCIWNTYLDIDGDGQNELCIGRGVSPSDAAPIVIYKPNGDAIYGDAIYAYNDLFYVGAPIEWYYLGG
ncbi:MAG: sigma-70 family RNA polymerase sigma factor [Clostridia bacterium]|nr:sigma-70 family RNA polymerase sigma factor [Clostridia bacterium]